MDSERIEERLRSTEGFLEIAKYLHSRPPIRVPIGSSRTEVEEIEDKHRWWRGITSHMLYAIVFEVSLKIIWELDNNEECRFTHNIRDLYNELAPDSQHQLQAIFDEKSTALARLQGTNKKGERIIIGELVELQSLRDALEANEDTMKNFKYETRFRGKSSVLGSVIWTDELSWILPSLNDSFGEALFRYTVDRVKEAGLE